MLSSYELCNIVATSVFSRGCPMFVNNDEFKLRSGGLFACVMN
jgi:hypothetical protein